MEIKQKRLSHHTDYVFEDEGLRYAWRHPSGSRSFTVAYPEISRERQTLVERNAWLRNAGWFWLALGAVLTGVRFMGGHDLVPSIWLPIGIACLLAYRWRTIGFTVVPTGQGNLLVIQDANGERILREIETRRAGRLRREYDFFPEGEDAEQLRRRFRWLHAEGVLSEEELAQRLHKIDATDPAVQAVNRLLSSL